MADTRAVTKERLEHLAELAREVKEQGGTTNELVMKTIDEDEPITVTETIELFDRGLWPWKDDE